MTGIIYVLLRQHGGGTDTEKKKSQHRKLTLEKKILPPLQPGLEPGTFRSRVRRSNHWGILAPPHSWRFPITGSTASSHGSKTFLCWKSRKLSVVPRVAPPEITNTKTNNNENTQKISTDKELVCQLLARHSVGYWLSTPFFFHGALPPQKP